MNRHSSGYGEIVAGISALYRTQSRQTPHAPEGEADSKEVLGQLWQICLGLWTEVSEPSAEMVEAVGFAVRAGSEEPWKLNGVTV
jgi:hypothetical protein